VNNLGNLTQISSSLENKLGGPTFLVANSSNHFGPRFSKHRLIVFGPIDVESNAEILEISTLFNNRFGFTFNIPYKRIRHLLADTDILLIHGFYLFSTLITILLSESQTIFLFPHGSMEPYQETQSKLRKLVFRSIFRLLTLRRNVVFMVASRREITGVEKLFPSRKVELAGYGITLPAGALTSKETPKKNDFVIGSIGRIHQVKRFDLVLAGLASCLDKGLGARLIIAGDGDSNLLDWLRKISIDLKLESKVDFIGSVTGESKEKFFQRIDVLLLLSDNESYAIVIAEAILRGIPVVVRSTVGMSDLVAEWHTGIVVSSADSSEVAVAVEQVLDKYQYYSANCLAHHLELEWDAVATNWERIMASHQKG
jgi:glycosyltransferase involved in cell wall biosynthesis